MLKEFTCIVCPNGCCIRAQISEDGTVAAIEGQLCPRGEDYVRQELTAPQRNIASSVVVTGGEFPLVSVRLTAPIPKSRIFDVMAEINHQHLTAPVSIGQVLVSDILGSGVDLVATKNCLRIKTLP
ncbi:MAG: DUF1667 domain-containing protein [Ruthenibacterium sp.]